MINENKLKLLLWDIVKELYGRSPDLYEIYLIKLQEIFKEKTG